MDDRFSQKLSLFVAKVITRNACGLRMAKRKSSRKKTKKHAQPVLAQLRYTFTGAAANTADNRFIDVAQGLSMVNRKLFEQGRMYHIKRIRFLPTIGVGSTATGAMCQVATAAPNWVVTQAWKKSKRLHTDMISGRGGAPGSQLPAGLTPATWGDFKVYLSKAHYDARTTVNVPEDSYAVDGSTTNYEWVYSEFTAPDEDTAVAADQFTSHLLGDDSGSAGGFNSVGIVKGYQESRRTVQEDDTDAAIVTSSWMVNLFDDGDTLGDITDTLRNEGNLPPYDLDDYPGADSNLKNPMTRGMVTTVAHQPGAFYLPAATLSGFDAPCGLLQTTFTCDQASVSYAVIIDVALGDYKGVKALPM